MAYARELKKAGQPAHVIHVVVDQTAGEPRDESQYVTLPNEREPDPSSSRAALAKMKEQFSVRYDNQIGIVDHVAPQEDEMILGRPTANAFFDTNLTKGAFSRLPKMLSVSHVLCLFRPAKSKGPKRGHLRCGHFRYRSGKRAGGRRARTCCHRRGGWVHGLRRDAFARHAVSQIGSMFASPPF